MRRQLIGQVLARMGKLSPMDIDEILEEQARASRPGQSPSATQPARRRFGEIAISWGLCDPEHIGEAWCRQLAEEGAHLDLNKVGVDPRAAHALSSSLARRLGALPVRAMGDMMIVASSRPMNEQEMAELSRALGKDLRFITVDSAQIEQAMKVYDTLAVAA